MDDIAVNIVRKYIEEHIDKSDKMAEFEVYTVWKCCDSLITHKHPLLCLNPQRSEHLSFFHLLCGNSYVKSKISVAKCKLRPLLLKQIS